MNMFLMRVSSLLLVAVVSISWAEGAGEDRIGTLLSMMADMGRRVNSLTESVTKIYRMEEETAEHMLKTEDRVAEIVQKEDDIETQMNTQIGMYICTGWAKKVATLKRNHFKTIHPF